MDDKLKVFWNLDVLVKMSRSKTDGPSLRVEEKEIEEKIRNYNLDKEEIEQQNEEESYDTSAEMADRNIEIITKKTLQTLKNQLKEKNKKLDELKNDEEISYKNTSMLREANASFEKYILSMQERIAIAEDKETQEKYNRLIAEAEEKNIQTQESMSAEAKEYEEVQERIIRISEEIAELEEDINKKKKLLSETQDRLENKDNYIDKTKKDKNDKKLADLDSKIDKLNQRLEIIRKDPKYLETKIKDVINDKEDPNKAKEYLVELINQVIKEPYINVPTDNALEAELLRATQARDAFANEMDQKTYNILDSNTPEKIRTEYLKERISNWQKELDKLTDQADSIDKDEKYSYETKDQEISLMIASMKKELKEFQKAYDEIPDSNLGEKATLKVALDEKNADIIAAEYIAQSFRKEEAEEIDKATRIIKVECEKLNQNIKDAYDEIDEIRNRLLSKKSGTIDISSQNRDKEILKELAQTVIDIKHRRQFPEPPINIIERLEELLTLDLTNSIEYDYIKNTNVVIPKDYDSFIRTEPIETIEMVDISDQEIEIDPTPKDKKGIKVLDEAEISDAEEILFAEGREMIDDTEDEEDEDDGTINISIGLNEEPEDNEEDEEIEETPEEEQNEEESSEEVEETIEEPEIEEPTEEITEEIEEADEAAEEITINIPTEETVEEETPIVEETVEQQPVAEEITEEQPIEEIIEENSSQPTEENDNIVSSENIDSELDEYIKNFGVQDS